MKWAELGLQGSLLAGASKVWQEQRWVGIREQQSQGLGSGHGRAILLQHVREGGIQTAVNLSTELVLKGT